MKVKLLVLFLMAVLLVSSAGFASITSAASGNSGKPDKVNLMVKFDNPANKDTVKAFALAGGGQIKYDWPELNMIAIRNVPLNTRDQISIIKGVKEMHLDELRYPLMLDESAYLINSNDVWSEGVTGDGVRVCIVDTGVGPNPNINVVAGYDFYNNDNDSSDDHGHGTHCAGIVTSTHSTYKGNSYGADIMAAKTINSQGGGYESDTVDGILWCAKGPDGTYGTGDEADVISISLGFSYHTGTCDSQPAASAANTAVSNGVFVVAASGNSCYTDKIGNPSCGSNVMSVGAVYDDNVGSKFWSCCLDTSTYADKIVCFSNGNDELDVVAPGSVITSLAPTTLDPDGIADMSGTSMSTPHVAGIGALLLEEDSTLTPQDVRMIISNTSVDLGYPWNRQGFGRVDAYAAWQAVSQTTTTSTTTISTSTSTTVNTTTTTSVTSTTTSTTTTIGEVCGDGYCAGSENGEDCDTCPADCIGGQGGTCEACWKGKCDDSCHPKKEGPDCSDCAPSYCCGDGTCEGAEDESNCYTDCFGSTTTTTTTTTTTLGQCKPRGPNCNCNGICDGRENHEKCPWDCP